MILRRAHPAPGADLDSESADFRQLLLEWYRNPRAEWLRLNLVSSVNGSAAGSDGTSDSITSETDRQILGVIRELSDVVLVGAASVRAEGYRVPKRSRLAVLTSSGDLEGHRIAADARDRLIVICPEQVADRIRDTFPGAAVLTQGGQGHGVGPNGGSLDAPTAIDLLREHGADSIVCEGGPQVASQLLAAGLVDELCLTVSPLLTTTTLPLPTTEARLTLAQLLVDESSSIYARWMINRSDASGAKQATR